MKLYKLENKKNNGYDSFAAVIVAANSEDEARLIHPPTASKEYGCYFNWQDDGDKWLSDAWCNNPRDVEVTFIGVADESVQAGIILESFNAG